MPRWPSCSLQSRGHRSHWMRPSASLCHHLPFMEFGDAVARDLAACEARVGRQAGFLQELREEGALVRDAFPDLRQEGGALAFAFEDDAVDSRLELAQQVRLVLELDALRRREQRYLDPAARPFVGGEPREA